MPLTLPQVISPDTPLDADEVQENFDTIASDAVNVAGDTLTGTLNAQHVIPVTDSTYDLGSNAKRWANLYVDSITGAAFNAFGTVAVSGQSDVVADTTNDTLTLAAGDGITITTTAGTDTVTLTADGEVQAGTSAVNAKAGGMLYQTVTAVGNVGSGEDTLWTQAVAANVLATNGDMLRIRAYGTAAANSNNKTWKLYWGSTSVTLGPIAQPTNTSWDAEILVTRTGASSQVVSAGVRNGTGLRPTVTTASETLSGAVTVKITGEATSNNDIVLLTGYIEWLPSGV